MAVIWWALWNFIVVGGLGIGNRCNNFLIWYIMAVAEMVPIDLADPEWTSSSKAIPNTILNVVVLGILFAALAIFY